jgi:hypothetical protein
LDKSDVLQCPARPILYTEDAGIVAASATDNRRTTMLAKIRIALVAALIVGTAGAALARTAHYQGPTGSNDNAVVTDEGQGRFAPADGGAP